MRLRRDFLVALVLVFAAETPAVASDLTLQRVMLSSGGVGYFEYEATVDGNAKLNLDVPLAQVDDVLKSLVVYDNGGRAGEITLAGRDPLARSFADLPFDQSALASTTALLNAFQGAQIRFGGDEPIVGQLVHAEDATRRGPDETSETLTRVSMLTDSGLRQVTVRDFDAIEFLDPALQAQLKTALDRVAAYRAQGRRQLTIVVDGDGERTVRIGYVVAMPLWKATYRMALPADSNASSARLQGWAVLENFSGKNWSDVELTLLSGNPVTFHQALYESYYVPRPTVPVESGDHVLPPPDTGAAAGEAAKATENTVPQGLPKATIRAMPTTAAPSPAPAPPPPLSPLLPAQMQQAAASEEATQVAFTLPYKVSVGAGQSLIVPLIDRDLPTQRVDLYQPTTTQTHPLAAVELTNAGNTSLPPGVLTLYQQGDGAEYLGDARLAALPADDKRLLSYAVDNKVTVTDDNNMRQSIVKATIAEGVMHLTRLNRMTTTDYITAAAKPPRLIIEKMGIGGWHLANTMPDHAERTPGGAYRVIASLDDKGKGAVTFVEEQPVEESVQLLDLSDDQLGVYVAAKELDPKVHQALADLAQRRRAVSRQQAELDRLNQEHTRLTDDEERLRDNYTVLKDDPTIHKSTLDKLKADDAAIDDNSAAISKTNAALTAAQADLAAYVSGLKL